MRRGLTASAAAEGRRSKFGMRAICFGVCAAAFATTVTPAWAVEPPLPSKKRFLSKSLDLCDMGNFYIGGVPKVTQFHTSATPGRFEQITIGQMYVQFMIPHKAKSWPLIAVHGTTYTGASLLTNDFGREGWMPHGVRKGIPMYGVDVPGRGRSGFDNSAINESIANGTPVSIARGLTDDDIMGGLFQSTYAFGSFGHLVPVGSTILDGTLIPHGAPGDPQPAEIHGNYPPQIALDVIDPAIAARVGAIGPAPNPANNKLLALQHYKQMVPVTESTLPGSTCPSCNPTTLPGYETFTPLAMAKLIEGLGGAIVVTHSQSGVIGHHLVRVMKERGTLRLLKGLVTLEGSCDLSIAGVTPKDLDGVPYMALKGDYNASLGVCPQTVAALNASPTRSVSQAATIELDAPAFRGKFNGVDHMMMLGGKSSEVFDVIANWLEKNVRGNPKVASCRSDGHDDDDDDHHHHNH